MTHAPHNTTPYFHTAQILCDGCDECEELSMHPAQVIQQMSKQEFIDAWGRAIDHERHGSVNASYAEIPVLQVLWAVAVQLEKRGVPLGHIPQFMIPSSQAG
jgi:hypothetical protein